MPDPHVREIGRMLDFDGRTVTVGIDYETVTISPGTARFTADMAEEFARMFTAACWQAARQVPGD